MRKIVFFGLTHPVMFAPLQALKVLKKSFLKRKREYKKVEGKMVFCNALEKVQREVAIMKKLAHTNLVKLHEVLGIFTLQ